MRFGNRVRQLRTSRHILQSKLAHTIGISVPYIIKVENEKLHFRDYPAEAIMRGIKKTEYRSVPTKIRGRIMIYDDQGRYSADEKAEMMDNNGITDIECADPPRRVSIGTVDLHDSYNDWHQRHPIRVIELITLVAISQPMSFQPFVSLETLRYKKRN